MKTRETRKTQNNYFNAILFLICFLKLKIFCKTLITRHLKLVLYNLRDLTAENNVRKRPFSKCLDPPPTV